MRKTSDIAGIESKIRKNYPYERYERRYFQLVELEFISKWLKTKEAVEEIGKENINKEIEMNGKTIKKLKAELQYILSTL